MAHASNPAAAESTPPVAYPLVARQPIFDANLRVKAYELLYRSESASTQATFDSAVHATAHVILNAFVDIGIEYVTAGAAAYINVPQAYLLAEHPLPAPEGRVTIEVLEGVEPSDEVLRRLQHLKEAGYRIALDDFIHRPELEPLVDIADCVKLDVMAIHPTALAEEVGKVRRPGVALLAEKVETQEDFDRCSALGFDYFQGYFFQKPRIIEGRRPSAVCLRLIETLSEVYADGADMAALSRIVSHDVALTYRLLRCLNSAAFSLRSKVESVSQAASLLGERKLRQWITLMVMTGVMNKPHELIITSLLRASMCELIGLRSGNESSGLFTAGLLSVLDALLDQPMDDLLSELPLAPEVKRAIIGRDGHLGKVLHVVLACERGDFTEGHLVGVSEQDLGDIMRRATSFADELRSHLSETGIPS